MTSISDILLHQNVISLHQALSSHPTGILLTGYDRFTRRAIIKAAYPTAPIHSISLFISADPNIQIPSPSPPILCLEDLDTNHEQESIQATLKSLFSRQSPCCTIIGSATLQSTIPPSLLRPGTFERTHRIQAPSAELRTKAWQQILTLLSTGNDQWKFSSAHALSSASPGYVPRDFHQILFKFLSRHPGLDVEDKASGTLLDQSKALLALTAAHTPMNGSTDLSFITSSVSSDDTLTLTDTRRVWHGCGGYHAVKQSLIRLCEWPIRHVETFRRLGVEPPKGLLLHGPHGCGKTKLALSFLRTLRHANHLHVNGPDLFSKYLGESEARVRALFERAASLVPCVIFIDELDAIGGTRGAAGGDEDGGGSGVERRVLGSLLTEMDGVSRGEVFVLGCASEIEEIDAALLRPGRLDHVVEVPRPRLEDRRGILEMLLAEVPFVTGEDGEREEVLRGEVVEKVAVRAEGWTGAGLRALCREAAMIAIEEGGDVRCVSLAHFEKALMCG